MGQIAMGAGSFLIMRGLLAAGMLIAAAPSFAQSFPSTPKATAAGDYRTKAEQYALARRAFEEVTSAYWKAIAEKRARAMPSVAAMNRLSSTTTCSRSRRSIRGRHGLSIPLTRSRAAA
jgi:hypothetical protein